MSGDHLQADHFHFHLRGVGGVDLQIILTPGSI